MIDVASKYIKKQSNKYVTCYSTKLIAVPEGVCCSSMLRVYECVFCYMCVRMPLSLRSIAGVHSSRALPGFPITEHHLCAFLM